MSEPRAGQNVADSPMIVLPGLRLGRLRDAVEKITGDRETTAAIMQAVEDHVERDAYRWGSACPIDDCGLLLDWNDDRRYFECLTHGAISQFGGTMLLVAFRPMKFDHD